jgi:hypothetical protein
MTRAILAEAGRPGITYRLLIATTDRLGPTARRTLDGQREPVGYVLRSHPHIAASVLPVPQAMISWPRSVCLNPLTVSVIASLT